MVNILDEKFSKKYRIHYRTEINLLFKTGKRIDTQFFYIKYLKNNLEHSRILISINGKVANAPNRNRIKRQIRESFRRLMEIKYACFDIAIVCKKQEVFKIQDFNQLWFKVLNFKIK